MRLADALAGELGDAVHLRSPVRRVRWSDDAVTAFTDDAEIEADAAVIAIPTPPLAEVEFDPPLQGPTADALRRGRVRPEREAVRADAGPAPSPARSCRSPGISGPTRSSAPTASPRPSLRATRARWRRSTRSPRTAPRPGSSGWPSCAPSWSSTLHPTASLLSTWHDDPWVRGAYSARSISSPLRDEDLARPIGPLHFAGEHTAGEWHGLMEGALRSGRRAAEQVLAIGLGGDLERDLVHVAPVPVLARLERADDRVAALGRVGARVAVRRAVAAADLSALAAEAQVHPAAPVFRHSSQPGTSSGAPTLIVSRWVQVAMPQPNQAEAVQAGAGPGRWSRLSERCR